MCAWRYNAGATNTANNTLASAGGGLPLGNGLRTFGGASTAGAFLRQNAMPSASASQAPAFGSRGQDPAGPGNVLYSDEEDEEDEYSDQNMPGVGASPHGGRAGQTGASARTVPPLSLTSGGGGVAAAAQAPVGSSLAGALLRGAGGAPASMGFRGNTNNVGKIAATLGGGGGFQAASLARKLFKTTGDVGGRAESEDDEEDEELVDLTENERDFVYNTRDLFDEVDPNLLSEDFVPHEHVVDIIASEETGGEAGPDEIADKLDPYVDLQEEIDMYLGDYIEEHHEEFNTAISDFSEMILAVSGSDDTLARLKVQLAEAASSLEDHSEQLHVLRLRAAKSLFMAEVLQSIQNALSREAELKTLMSGRHYLAAVRVLEKHRQSLSSEQMMQVRSTQGIRDFADGLASTMHSQIVDDLLACVFRQERLQDVDSQMLQEMLSAGDGEAITGDVRGAAPNVQRTVKKYWSAMKGRRYLDTGADDDRGGDNERSGDAPEQSAPASGSLAAIAESVFDDPSDNTVSKDYLRFIPICVRSLIVLDKLDLCHEAFFSKATKSIEKFIAHFLRLYDAWRRKALVSSGSASERSADSAVRAIRVKAFDLISDTCSGDEAVATIQARELRAMLTALFTELEKILRNADYLHKIILVSFYPFISNDLVKTGPFDVESSHLEWEVDEYVVADADQFRNLIDGAIDFVQRKIRDMEDAVTAQNILTRFDEFFTFDKFVQFMSSQSSPPPAPLASPGVSAGVVGGAAPSPPSSPASTRFTIHALAQFVQSAVKATLDKYGAVEVSGPALQFIQTTLLEEVRNGLRESLADKVKALQMEWDLTPLWAQLNYHMELVFHVLCDAKSTEDDGDDLVTLQPFLRQKNLTQRVQRAAANVREAERFDDATTLEKLISSFQSGGLLRMIEETGPVSFSIVGAVRKAQNDVRKANAGQARQFQAMHSDAARLTALVEAGAGGAGGGTNGVGTPIVLLQASTLQNWFVFTAMNVLTCYQCASRFYDRCRDRAPEVLRSQSENESVIGFFKRFIRSTYIPTLHAFHSEQLRQRFVEMGDMVVDGPLNGDSTTADDKRPPVSPGNPASSGVQTAKSSTPSTTNAPAGAAASTAAGAPKTAWPTVTVAGAPYPVLSCVCYVGHVLEKVAGLRRVLPFSIVDDVEQSTSEALITELCVFLKRRVQWLGRGTIQYRLLNGPFEDAFAGLPNTSWATLCNESKLLLTQRWVDHGLYLYYQYNSEERTSGHEYNEFDGAAAVASLEQDRDDKLDRRIGMIAAKDLCLHDDSAIVGLAVLCFSAEWLCDVVLRFLWPGGNRTAQDYADSAVPGYLFATQLAVADSRTLSASSDGNAAHLVRLSGHLMRLCTLSQVSLFYLTIETRFCAFQYLPQLRDESYSTLATSSSADNFVQAYARRINTIYSLLRQHLARKKIKYSCITVAGPASELILSELAHLRDKGISAAGLSRLRTNLMVLQTALQLILPTDTDVRSAVGHFFTRPAVFVRYISNRDVVNDLISSGDYRMFTNSETECLIRLVFRQVSGANDDSLANQSIALFQSKLKAIEELRTGTIRQSSRLVVPGGTEAIISRSTSRGASTVRVDRTLDSDSCEEDEDEDEAPRSRGVGGGGDDGDGITLQKSQSKSSAVRAPLTRQPNSTVGVSRLPAPSATPDNARPAVSTVGAGATAKPTATPTPETRSPAPHKEPSNSDEEEEYEEEEEEEEEEDVAPRVPASIPPTFAAPLPTHNRFHNVSVPAPQPLAAARVVTPPLYRDPQPGPAVPKLATTAAAPARPSSSSSYEYEEEEEEEEEYEYEEEEPPAVPPTRGTPVPASSTVLSRAPAPPVPAKQPPQAFKRPPAKAPSSSSSYEYEEVTEETEEEEEDNTSEKKVLRR